MSSLAVYMSVITIWHFIIFLYMLITVGKYFFSEQEKLGLSRIRTGDLWVTSPSLYQLSYQPDAIFKPNQSQRFLHTNMATQQSHAEFADTISTVTCLLQPYICQSSRYGILYLR